ncbi:hypothetical protein [Thermospira aquatica]|uniref:Uncharacterized protein n=1 Tax=Thermospira aquatica TaxID=2828656 RepID=A0AAX3BEI3_9SPIR|nr:hypothetical protein [Thermospira aquatica]URA10752.1 hypothetical protein KDW03_02815 [Thermospira aquatica]
MKRFFLTLSWIFLVVMILVLSVGNVFYSFWQVFFQKYFSTAISTSEPFSFATSQKYEITLQFNKGSFLRYEPIPFSVIVRDRKKLTVVSNVFIRVQVKDGTGRILRDIRGYDELWLQYDQETGDWRGLWYPSLEENPDTVRFVASAQFQDPAEPIVVEREVFLRQRPSLRNIRQGMTFFFIEEMESLSRRSLLSVDNEERDWNTLPQWMSLLNVDGVFVMGGVTRFMEEYSLQDPWNNQKLQESLTISRWASGQGRSCGIWVKAFRGDGNLISGTGYESSWYQKDNQWVRDVSTISFQVESRYRSLAALLNSLSQQESVSYVGLSDFLLPDNYAMELAIPFVETMVSRLPDDWTNRTWEQKFAFARNYIENQQNYQVFTQWKRYYLVSRLRDILGPIRKPLFYVLNWEELEARPDMLEVLAQAGFDFFVVQLKMSYREFLDRGKQLLEHSAIRLYLSRIVWVNQVQYQNFYLSSERTLPIDGFVAMNEHVVKNTVSSEPSLGLAVNFYKAMYGNRGPYNPIEWLMGAGESFRRIREIFTSFPLDIDVVTPRSVDTNANTFLVRLRLQNRSLLPLEKLSVEYIPTRMVRLNGTPRLDWNTLAPGETSEALLSFSLDLASDKFVRDDILVALRVSWSQGGKSDSTILMRSIFQNKLEQ